MKRPNNLEELYRLAAAQTLLDWYNAYRSAAERGGPLPDLPGGPSASTLRKVARRDGGMSRASAKAFAAAFTCRLRDQPKDSVPPDLASR